MYHDMCIYVIDLIPDRMYEVDGWPSSKKPEQRAVLVSQPKLPAGDM